MTVYSDPVVDNIKQLISKKNIRVQLAQNSYKIAQSEFKWSDFDFDYNLSLSIGHESETVLSEYTYQDSQYDDKTTSVGLGVTKKWDFGLESEFSLQQVVIKSTSSQSYLPKRDQSALLIKVTQPILKGFGDDINQYQIKKTKINLRRYKLEFQNKLDDEIAQALELISNIHKVSELMKITNEKLKREKEILKFNEVSLKAGKTTHVDLLNAKTRVALAESDIVMIQKDLEFYKIDLAMTLYGEYHLFKETELNELFAINWDSLLPKNNLVGLSTNQKIWETKLKISNLDTLRAKDGLFPTLDLEMEYLSSGLSTIPSRSFSQVVRQDYPSWSLMLSLSYPIGNSYAKGTFQTKKISHERNLKEKLLALNNEKNKRGKAYIDLSLVKQKLNSIKRKIILDSQLVNAKQKLYKLGVLSWRELQDAFMTLDLTKKSEVNYENELQKLIIQIAYL